MKKIGVMGGTFDPVHCGHIELAKATLDQLCLDEVLMVPAKLQPFKLYKQLTNGHNRMRMLELAVEHDEKLIPCDIELKQDGISYTINTLRHIKAMKEPNAEIVFITGTDSFLKMDTWKEGSLLLQSFSIAVGTRPGYLENEVAFCIEHYTKEYNSIVYRVNNPQVDVSSTEIRNRIKDRQPLTDLVPRAVEGYIYENGLYK